MKKVLISFIIGCLPVVANENTAQQDVDIKATLLELKKDIKEIKDVINDTIGKKRSRSVEGHFRKGAPGKVRGKSVEKNDNINTSKSNIRFGRVNSEPAPKLNAKTGRFNTNKFRDRTTSFYGRDQFDQQNEIKKNENVSNNTTNQASTDKSNNLFNLRQKLGPVEFNKLINRINTLVANGESREEAAKSELLKLRKQEVI